MTNGEIVEYITKLVFATNGSLENNLMTALENCDASVKQRAMTLYIYYKATVMDQIVTDISPNRQERDNFANLLLHVYNDYVNQHQIGIDMHEMIAYMQRFLNIGVKGTNINKCVDLILGELGPSISDAVGINMKFSFNMSKTYDFLKTNVANKQNSGNSTARATSSSGCLLPLVAAVFIIGILIYL